MSFRSIAILLAAMSLSVADAFRGSAARHEFASTSVAHEREEEEEELVQVRNAGRTYSSYAHLANVLGVYDKGWVNRFNDVEDGDIGTVLARTSTPVDALAIRLHRNGGVICIARDGVEKVIGYVCRTGQGQPGQSYRVFAGELAICKAKCDADQNCMGIDSTAQGAGEDACRLYGANVPHIGDAGEDDRQYCTRMDFDIAGAKPVPGDESFVPHLEWVESVLHIPMEELACKTLSGGGSEGQSGCSFFKCDGRYGGSAMKPTLGLPTKLFVKTRNPPQGVDALKPENAVTGLAQNMARPPPIRRVLSYDRNYMIMENMGSPIDDDYMFTEAEVKALLDSYAEFHAAFWGLARAPGLLSYQAWSFMIGTQMLPVFLQAAALDWFHVPEPGRGLFKRALDEIGFDRIIAHMNTFGMTLIQGDTHSGQILRLSEGSSGTESGRTWGIIDFDWAHLGSPAIDIGSLMGQLNSAVGDLEFITYYWKQLVGHTGCSEPGSPNPYKLPSCSMDRFILDCRVAAALRGLTLAVATAFAVNPVNPMADKDYMLKNPHSHGIPGGGLAGVHRLFKFFDQDAFDYLAENMPPLAMRRRSSDSSLMPPPAVIAREFRRLG